MQERLADSVPQLAALAAQALGWKPREFWSATPAELALSLAPPAGAASRDTISRDDIDRMTATDTHKRHRHG
ncbi:phage tail assembly chaperone [Qipengyuania sp. DSG2-2]|uniref:phage tail assembly chaperone n=1 Tax=Qipengyuania sp. DGS2-2 TaxID=3349631 RepID=UPI0036D2FA71